MLPPKRKGQDGRKNNKPPKQHQFKKGESGNKKGRPKKIPTVLDLVEQELDSKHVITIGTRQIRVPLRLLLVKQVLRRAMKGDSKALFWAIEQLDTIQTTNAKRQVQRSYVRPDLENMTDDERTELYFKTIRAVNGKTESDD